MQPVTMVFDVVERQHGTQQAAAKVRQSSEELRSSAEGNVKLTVRYRIQVPVSDMANAIHFQAFAGGHVSGIRSPEPVNP